METKKQTQRNDRKSCGIPNT